MEYYKRLRSFQTACDDSRCVDKRKRYSLLAFVLTHFQNGKTAAEDVLLKPTTESEYNAETVDHQTTLNTPEFLFQLHGTSTLPEYLDTRVLHFLSILLG